MIFKFSVNDSLTTASYYEITRRSFRRFHMEREKLEHSSLYNNCLVPKPCPASNARTGGESGN